MQLTLVSSGVLLAQKDGCFLLLQNLNLELFTDMISMFGSKGFLKCLPGFSL